MKITTRGLTILLLLTTVFTIAVYFSYGRSLNNGSWNLKDNIFIAFEDVFRTDEWKAQNK